MNVRFVLIILLLVAPILMTTESAFSSESGVTEPSVPEFTVGLEDQSYDVPSTTTTTIDEYTGEKKVVTTPGYRVEKECIVIRIKSQPFTHSFNGTNYYMFYNIRTKGHFGEDWKELYSYSTSYSSSINSFNSLDDLLKMSYPDAVVSLPASNYPSGAEVDFQVKAIVYYDTSVPVHNFVGVVTGTNYYRKIYDISVWSETQTITIQGPVPEISFSSPQNQTYTEDNVNLNFTVNEETSWMGYSLDGQANVTITETTLNLTELTNGSHILTLYANGTYPDTETSQTISFNINKAEPEPQPEQLNTILTVALILVPIATAIGLVIYLKRKQSGNTRNCESAIHPSN